MSVKKVSNISKGLPFKPRPAFMLKHFPDKSDDSDCYADDTSYMTCQYIAPSAAPLPSQFRKFPDLFYVIQFGTHFRFPIQAVLQSYNEILSLILSICSKWGRPDIQPIPCLSIQHAECTECPGYTHYNHTRRFLTLPQSSLSFSIPRDVGVN